MATSKYHAISLKFWPIIAIAILNNGKLEDNYIFEPKNFASPYCSRLRLGS